MIKQTVQVLEELTEKANKELNETKLLEILATREIVLIDFLKEVKLWKF